MFLNSILSRFACFIALLRASSFRFFSFARFCSLLVSFSRLFEVTFARLFGHAHPGTYRTTHVSTYPLAHSHPSAFQSCTFSSSCLPPLAFSSLHPVLYQVFPLYLFLLPQRNSLTLTSFRLHFSFFRPLSVVLLLQFHILSLPFSCCYPVISTSTLDQQTTMSLYTPSTFAHCFIPTGRPT